MGGGCARPWPDSCSTPWRSRSWHHRPRLHLCREDVFPRIMAGKLINPAYYVQLHIAQKKFLIPDSDNARSVIMHRLVSVHPEKILNLLSIKVDHVLGNFQTIWGVPPRSRIWLEELSLFWWLQKSLLSLFLLLLGWDFNMLVSDLAGVNWLWPFMVHGISNFCNKSRK